MAGCFPPPSSSLPCRRSAVLVSKRWQRVFFSEPALWRRFQLARPSEDLAFSADFTYTISRGWSRWCASWERLLGRVAGMVQEFEGLALPSSCARCLALLRPELLEQAAVDCEQWDEAEVEQLLRFPRLARLRLRPCFRMPAAVCGVLARMPQLRSLALEAQDLDWELASIAKLTQLTRLSLAVYDPLGDGMDMSPWEVHEPPLLQLTQLQRLRHLSIVHKGTDYPDEQQENAKFADDGSLVLPELSEFPALDSFNISFREDQWYHWNFSVSRVRRQ